MTGSKLSQRAARRRGELHRADGDRRVALTIEAQRHLNTPAQAGPVSSTEGGGGGMTETTPWLSEILESERPRARQHLSALAAAVRNHEDAKRE